MKAHTYQNKIVTFFDIMGFKKLIDDSEKPESAASQVAKLASMFNRIDEIVSEYSDSFYCVRFSDSIVIIQASPPKYERNYFKFIVAIHHFLMREGLLVRGAMVKGDVYYDQSGRYVDVFGPALVKAYQLEQKAVYPRVIVDESVANGITIHTVPHGTEFTIGAYFDNFGLTKDSDGFYFVDYLFPIRTTTNEEQRETLIFAIDSLIKSGLTSPDEMIATKYRWLEKHWANAQEKRLQM